MIIELSINYRLCTGQGLMSSRVNLICKHHRNTVGNVITELKSGLHNRTLQKKWHTPVILPNCTVAEKWRSKFFRNLFFLPLYLKRLSSNHFTSSLRVHLCNLIWVHIQLLWEGIRGLLENSSEQMVWWQVRGKVVENFKPVILKQYPKLLVCCSPVSPLKLELSNTGNLYLKGK